MRRWKSVCAALDGGCIMQFWNNFAAKHLAAAKWVREGGLFVIVSNLITVFKYLLLQFLPAARTLPEVEPETIPEHLLFAGDGGSGPAPSGQCADTRVLSEVVVPKKITVHLARPAVSAANVTVSFQDYIANVASSEVYPLSLIHI